MSVKETDNSNTTEANATRGSVYTIHKYKIFQINQQQQTLGTDKHGNFIYTSGRDGVLEKVRMRTFYFENILQNEGMCNKKVKQSRQQLAVIQSILCEVAV